MNVENKSLVIIGAGIAALVCALELKALGYDVLLLEATRRAGGRIHTERQAFSEGMFCELGATFIGPSHDLTLRYVQQAGLKLIDVPTNASKMVHINGSTVSVPFNPTAELPIALTADERELGYGGILKKYLSPGFQVLGDPHHPDWPPPTALHLDTLTMKQYLLEQGASIGVIDLFSTGYIGLLGDGMAYTSALQCLLNLQLAYEKPGPYQTIVGGMDQLPKALASKLEQNIWYGCSVQSLAQDETGVTIQYLQSGNPATIRCHRAIIAVPFSVLRGMHVTPSFSEEKNFAIQNQLSTSVTRTIIQTRDKYWTSLCQYINIDTDMTIKWLFDAACTQLTTRGLLCSFSTGSAARDLARMDSEPRIKRVVAEIERVLPGIMRTSEGGISYDWDNNPYARGAYAWYKPGDMTRMLHTLSLPEGRIYFAGDHTSYYPGWIQGAISSALRAVNQVTNNFS